MKVELIEERADDVFSEYTLGPHFIDFCRGPHVPSTSQDQGVQAALHRRRLLERRREEQAAAAHLRHRLVHQEGARRVPRTSSKKPRSATIASWARSSTCSASRNSPGPGLIFFHPKGGIVRKQLEDWMRDAVSEARLLAGLHAARDARASCGRPPATPISIRENMFTPHGAGRRRIPAQADELPGPHPDLSRQAAQLSRPAGAAGRAGHGLPLRALRHHARPAARARIYPGRRAHLLHAGADRRRDRRTACEFAIDTLKTFGFDRIRSRALHLGRRRERQIRRRARPVGARPKDALRKAMRPARASKSR